MEFEKLNRQVVKSEDLKKFIEDVCNKFIKELRSGKKDLGENPLEYRERTLSSYFFPALMKSSRRSLMELYFEKDGEKDRARRHADFYSLSHDGKYSYIIEFKQVWNESGLTNGKIIERWNIVNEQLKDMNKENIKFIDNGKKIYGISFLVIVTIKKVGINRIDCKMELENILKSEFKDAHWIMNWKVTEDLKDENDVDSFEYVTMIGKVNKLF